MKAILINDLKITEGEGEIRSLSWPKNCKREQILNGIETIEVEFVKKILNKVFIENKNSQNVYCY